MDIQVNDLNLFYGDFQALKDIDLSIKDKTITALIGPSGCGKSTFLRCINRMNDLIASVKITGEIIIDGEDIYDRRTDVYELRKKVGMVFQKPTPFPKSIFDNVAYGLRVNGIRKKSTLEDTVEFALKQSALWEEVKDDLKKPALALSGGQQQRLCIARTIATKPEIILMDEPTSALDPISTGQIETLLQELKQKYTIVIVTHNMQQAARVSDKTAFFYFGYIEEYDDTDVIFNRPAKERTSNYVNGQFG